MVAVGSKKQNAWLGAITPKVHDLFEPLNGHGKLLFFDHLPMSWISPNDSGDQASVGQVVYDFRNGARVWDVATGHRLTELLSLGPPCPRTNICLVVCTTCRGTRLTP